MEIIRKSFLLLSLSMLVACAGGRPQTNWKGSGPRRVAVVPFDSSNPFVSGNAVGDCFTVEILRRKGFQVIERKDLFRILQEQKLSLSGILGSEKFMKLGTILGVDAILAGSVHTLETLQGNAGSISVTAKLMEVSTGRILWADRQKISHSGLGWKEKEVGEVADILMEKAARKMVEKMERNLKSVAVTFPGPAPDALVQKRRAPLKRPRPFSTSLLKFD